MGRTCLFTYSFIVIVALAWCSGAGAEEAASAWDQLSQSHAAPAAEASELEKQALQLLSPSSLRAYLAGVDAADIPLLNGETLAELLERAGPVSFDLTWFTIDGGAGRIEGGAFNLLGSLGQPDAGAMSGGAFTLKGGFLGLATSAGDGDPCSGPKAIHCDGFESGDTSAWTQL